VKSRKPLSLSAIAMICSTFVAFSQTSTAATAANLLTICTSATTTTQASKCTAWQYNVYSPAAYTESYPQVSPGPKGYTDPLYAYRLGSAITSTMGVKVCPTALVPGTSYTSAAADPCPNNVLVSASSVIPSHYIVTVGQLAISVFSVINSQLTPLPGSPYSLAALSITDFQAYLKNAVLVGNYLYVITGCCSPHAPSTIYSYSVSPAGLTFIAATQIFSGTSTETAIATFPTQNYIYFVDQGYGSVPSYLETAHIAGGIVSEPNSPLQLSCIPQAASLDSTGSYLLVDCAIAVDVISLAPPGSPVEIAMQAADAGVTVTGN
jgi:hypothetical protein